MQDAKILIVEDERITALGIKHKLERLGYVVVGMESSGEDAIQKSKELFPDLVLMDIILKGKMDGIDAASKIKKELNIPIVYLTAHFENSTIERAKLTRPDGYITKPFSDSNLKSVIETALYKYQHEEPKTSKSEEKYRQIVEYANEGIFVFDQNFKITYINQKLAKMLGYTRDELRDKPLKSLMYNEDIKYNFSVIESLKKRFSKTHEMRLRHKKGSEIWAKISFSTVKEEKTNFAILTDITQYKKSQEVFKKFKKSQSKIIKDLRNEETVFKGLLSNFKSGITIYETKNDGSNFIFKYLNKKAEKIENIKKEDVIGKNVIGLLPDLKNKNLFDIIQRVWKTGNPEQFSTNIYKYQQINGWINYFIYRLSSKEVVSVFDEVTDQKRAESALKESEKKYRQLVENAHIGICKFGFDGIINFINPQMAEMLGYEISEMLQKSIFSFIDSKNVDILKEYMNSANFNGNYEFEFIKKDKNKIYTNLEISFIFDEKGNKEEILMIISDITERKKAENVLKSDINKLINAENALIADVDESKKAEIALKQSLELKSKVLDTLKENEEYMNIIFANIQTGIIIVNAETKEIIDLNKAASNLIGLSRDDTIGKDYHEFIGSINNVKQENDNFETILNTASNEKIPIMGKMVSITLKDQECLLCSFVDIKNLKKLENSIQKKENYKDLIEASPEAFFASDLNGNINFVSSKSLQLFGLQKIEDILKKSIFEFITSECQTKAKNDLKEFINGEEQQNLEYEFIRADRTNFIGEVNFSIIRDNGQPVSIVFTLKDVTDTKDTEDQIEASLIEKEILIKEIHQNVENNLNIISNLLDHQSNNIDDDSTLEIFNEDINRIKAMAIIHENLYKSDSLVKINFKDYTTELSENLLHYYKISPNMIKLYNNIEDKCLNFDTAVSCGLIINELLTNSIKHAFPWFKTPKSLNETFGNIEFGKYKIEIRLDRDNDNYHLVIADNGFGFPEDIDFKNTDTLGLKLVNNLVQQLDGTIKLDKTYGTKFTIVFKEKSNQYY